MAKPFFITFSLVFLATALAIPELYQSMTLWYKYGTERVLLKAGQSAGMVALVLLNLQLLLAVKGKWLTEAFGPAKLMQYHRTNGVLISLFAFAHVLLVLLPEGLQNIPFGMKFWPEMTGAALLLLLVVTIIVSKYRTQFKLAYPFWRTGHKIIGYSLIFLLNIHVLFVSDTFEQLVPKIFLAATLMLVIAWIAIVKIKKN